MSLRSTIRLALSLGRGLSKGLPDADEGRDPVELFSEWFQAANEAGILLPESMTLATATPSGVPSARMVLLKSFDEQGFVFYTNYGSRKAEELTANPSAALCLHWGVLQRQVRIEGSTRRVAAEVSRAYFRTRPRGSKIAAWASRQSQPLGNRRDFDQRVAELEKEFAGADVPLPPFWGGFILVPTRIEFWQGRPSRMHDRLVFEREGDDWSAHRLHP